MKRAFLAIAVLLVTCAMVYAQDARPTTSQTLQAAQQFLSAARTNATQFESTKSDQNTRSNSNRDADTFSRIRNEIEMLEATIKTEQERIDASLASGRREDTASQRRIQQLMDQHQAKMAELEAFIARIGTN